MDDNGDGVEYILLDRVSSCVVCARDCCLSMYSTGTDYDDMLDMRHLIGSIYTLTSLTGANKIFRKACCEILKITPNIFHYQFTIGIHHEVSYVL